MTVQNVTMTDRQSPEAVSTLRLFWENYDASAFPLGLKTLVPLPPEFLEFYERVDRHYLGDIVP